MEFMTGVLVTVFLLNFSAVNNSVRSHEERLTKIERQCIVKRYLPDGGYTFEPLYEAERAWEQFFIEK